MKWKKEFPGNYPTSLKVKLHKCNKVHFWLQIIVVPKITKTGHLWFIALAYLPSSSLLLSFSLLSTILAPILCPTVRPSEIFLYFIYFNCTLIVIFLHLLLHCLWIQAVSFPFQTPRPKLSNSSNLPVRQQVSRILILFFLSSPTQHTQSSEWPAFAWPGTYTRTL